MQRAAPYQSQAREMQRQEHKACSQAGDLPRPAQLCSPTVYQTFVDLSMLQEAAVHFTSNWQTLKWQLASVLVKKMTIFCPFSFNPNDCREDAKMR